MASPPGSIANSILILLEGYSLHTVIRFLFLFPQYRRSQPVFPFNMDQSKGPPRGATFSILGEGEDGGG